MSSTPARTSDAPASEQSHVALTAAVGLCSVAVALVTWVADGNAVLAVVPVVAALACVGLYRLPMRLTAHAVLFLALLIDNPTERPGRNLYHSPTYAVGQLLYETLSKSLHVPIKFTGLQLLLLVLCAISGLRILFAHRTDGRHRLPAARPMVQACLTAMGALIALFVFGMGRGGAANYAIVQMQTMFFLPAMTLFFAYAFKHRRDVKALLNTLLIVGVSRALQCIFYWLTVMRHQAGDAAGGQEGDGSYVTTHSDSILAVVVVIICIVNIYQQPRWRAFLLAGLLLPPVGLGIVANNRRIAFVAIAFGMLFSYLSAGGPFRRRMHQTVMFVAPVLLAYLAAGWSAHGSWAKPVQSLRSVIEQKDTSSATRDIENFNLLLTLRQAPILGSGFGHKYIERQHAYDISKIFEAYRYVPHNSILWFWGVGGVVGFSGFWMFISVGIFFSARLVRMAEDNDQAVLGMAAMTAVIAYSMQCFGDMGLMSWMGALIVASTLGAVASMVNKTAAWGNMTGVVRRTGVLPQTFAEAVATSLATSSASNGATPATRGAVSPVRATATGRPPW